MLLVNRFVLAYLVHRKLKIVRVIPIQLSMILSSGIFEFLDFYFILFFFGGTGV
jgi:hypothetical protein